MHLSKHWDDQACVIGDRCQWLFVSHVEVAHVQMVVPLRTEFPVFWEFLGIPRNS